MSLYTINQFQYTGSTDTSTVIIYFTAIVIATLVIVVKSPVVSILYLIGLFCTIAIYLVKSGMTFAGLIYLLVYVGAISILFIFIVMLLNVRISELLTEGKNSTFLAVLSVISIYFLFSNIIPGSGSEGYYNLIQSTTHLINYVNTLYYSSEALTISPNELNIACVSSKSWDGSLAEISHISSVGNVFYTTLIIPLIAVSVIILEAMVGAIVITVRSINRYNDNEQDINNSINETTINLNS